MPINEDVQLTRANEKVYMQKFEDLLAGDTKSIGPDQAEALLGVRYEFYRREITIKMLIKEMKNVQEEMDRMATENFEMADTVSKQIEYNKLLFVENDELKRENQGMGFNKPQSKPNTNYGMRDLNNGKIEDRLSIHNFT